MSDFKATILAFLAFPFLALASLAQTGPSVPALTTNSSAVIATGNTFQTVLVALVPPAYRHSLTISNNNAADSCWIYLGSGSAAKGTSILLLAGAIYTRYFPYVPSDPIQATCATTSDTLYIDYN